ncbi:GCN5-related N-acetyltransferase [Novosphingobium nitrogenifigens DSM 19370]|uniref:GCN5-related N-acetyltransferase n=1 Tax=Novosphingobium nitrogenifigens DSM 19370 TaxID=983920 RepID=F1ZAL2_9SPHN|nr:GNAT family protein [Novosphingobium nitrogenifigens]EGD58351.1 GCN5-related N-acetyltransferase [Novosphingobium nitrogenifigens DSM 19370]
MSDTELYVPLAEGDLELVLLTEAHREGLRAACAQDSDVWTVYPTCWIGEHFDLQFDKLLTAAPHRRAYAICRGGEVVGMTAWIDQGQPGWSIEIGNSFIAPSLRGTGFNRRVKQLMIDHAFACGLERVGFKVDMLNERSRAAVAKLGAVEEGVLRHERKTWTGRVRDTVSFSILSGEWKAAQGA